MKQRYSVFRAELNQNWENIFEKVVRQICEDNNLNVDEHYVPDKRTPWEHTWESLRTKNYWLQSRCFADMQGGRDRRRFIQFLRRVKGIHHPR